MANNRIYLRCKACGKVLYLGKHYEDGWWYDDRGPEPVTLKQMLNEFYDAHAHCGGWPLECFDIKYETAPNKAVDAMEMARDKLDAVKVPFEGRYIKMTRKTAEEMLTYYTGQTAIIADDDGGPVEWIMTG